MMSMPHPEAISEWPSMQLNTLCSRASVIVAGQPVAWQYSSSERCAVPVAASIMQAPQPTTPSAGPQIEQGCSQLLGGSFFPDVSVPSKKLLESIPHASTTLA